jgi:hypothetical protein
MTLNGDEGREEPLFVPPEDTMPFNHSIQIIWQSRSPRHLRDKCLPARQPAAVPRCADLRYLLPSAEPLYRLMAAENQDARTAPPMANLEAFRGYPAGPPSRLDDLTTAGYYSSDTRIKLETGTYEMLARRSVFTRLGCARHRLSGPFIVLAATIMLGDAVLTNVRTSR